MTKKQLRVQIRVLEEDLDDWRRILDKKILDVKDEELEHYEYVLKSLSKLYGHFGLQDGLVKR